VRIFSSLVIGVSPLANWCTHTIDWCVYTESFHALREGPALIPVHTPGTIGHVPNKPKTQHRSMRVDTPEWADLEIGAEDIDLDRSKVINQLVKWWLRRPGAELPERPSDERMEEIVAARLLAPTVACPECKVTSGPCMAGKPERPTEAIHRPRLDAAAALYSAQQNGSPRK